MITYEHILRITKKLHVAISVGNTTHYISQGTVELSDDKSITFIDLLRDKAITLADQQVDEILLYCQWPVDSDWKQLTRWFNKNKKSIELNNSNITQRVDNIKSMCGKYFQPVEDNLLFAESQNWYTELSSLRVFVEMSEALELKEPAFTLNHLNNVITIPTVKKKWKKIITEHYDKAIIVLNDELDVAEKDDDQDAIQEINIVKRLLRECIDTIDMSDLKTVKDVLLYWPPLLLPAPEYTAFLRV